MGRSPEPAIEVDLDSFPLVAKGNHYDDFVEGDELVHHWGRTLTGGDNAVFSTATCNWNPMHLNAEFARAHGHDDMVVNPMLVLCTVVGLSVEDLSEVGGPFLGMENVEFHRAVYPGDTITASSIVKSKRESEKFGGSGIVTWRTVGANQRDEVVVSFERTNLVAKTAGSLL